MQIYSDFCIAFFNTGEFLQIWIHLDIWIRYENLSIDGYDDYQRRKQDRFLNNKKVSKILENGEIDDCAWQDVMTGNLLLVKKDESIPADLVLLSSYDEEGRLW